MFLFFFFSCRKTLLGPVYGSSIEQVQILPVKSTLELQKRYMVFINRDKVWASALCLCEMTLWVLSGSQPQVGSDSRMLGVIAQPLTSVPVHSDTEICHKWVEMGLRRHFLSGVNYIFCTPVKTHCHQRMFSLWFTYMEKKLTKTCKLVALSPTFNK